MMMINFVTTNIKIIIDCSFIYSILGNTHKSVSRCFAGVSNSCSSSSAESMRCEHLISTSLTFSTPLPLVQVLTNQPEPLQTCCRSPCALHQRLY